MEGQLSYLQNLLKRSIYLPHSNRESNIELLRIFTAMGVVILHYNYGRALQYVDQSSLNFGVLIGLESFWICAVDLFVLISGYFLYGKKSVSIMKVAELLLQVSVFRVFLGLTPTIIRGDFVSLKDFFKLLLPMNYFVILYLVVYVLSPYINTLLLNLSDLAFKRLLAVTFVLFSLLPTINDTVQFLAEIGMEDLSTIGREGSNYGYSLVNFMQMYLIGAYIKRTENEKKKLSSLMFKILICWSILFVWGFFGIRAGMDINFSYSYCNPFVIILAVYLFLFFRNMDIGNNIVVNILANGSFAVYLTHKNFLSYLHIENYANANVIVLVGHILGSVIILYLVGFFAYVVYSFFLNLVEKMIPNSIKQLKIKV